MYSWSDDSAMWELLNGASDEKRESAIKYVYSRLDGHSEIISNIEANRE
jgi:hypothetical protein